MIASWPSELDPPMRQGFEQAFGEGRLITRSEGGPPSLRGRFSSTPDIVALTLDLSRNELARFDRFWAEEIGRGALPFLMENPTTFGIHLADETGAWICDEAGNPILVYDVWICQIGTQLPARTVIGVRWRLSLRLAVMP